MAIEITIQNRVIEFPESAEDPNWAPALVEFAQAVEAAIATITGSFDVAPQVFNIDAFNTTTNQDIPALNFPNTDVRSATIQYAVIRTTDAPDASAVYEGGTIELLYDPSKTVGSKWDLVNEHQGDAKIAFSITDAGQIQFSTETITGLNHTGFITFRALSVLNT